MTTDKSILTLRDVIKVLFKHKMLIATVTLVAVITSTAVVYLKPPLYKSLAQILVRRAIPESQDPSLNSTGYGGQSFFRQIDQADEMNTAISILKSRDLIETAIKNLDLSQEEFDKVPDFRRYVRYIWNWCRDTGIYIWNETKFFLHLSSRPTAEEIAMLKWERFVNLVLQAVIVEQIPDSDVLNVGIQMNDPYKARDFARVLSEMALAWHYEKFRQTGNISFFNVQVDQYAEELVGLEKKLAEMRHNLNLFSADDRRKHIIESRFLIETRLNTVRATLAADKAGIRQINQFLAEEPPDSILSRESGVNPRYQQIIDKISDLELRRAIEAEKQSEGSRILRDMNSTIASWKKYLKAISPQQEKTVIKGINTIHQNMRQKRADLEAERAALAAEAEILAQRIDEYDSELTLLSNNILQIADLQRRIHSAETVYAQYLSNSEQARSSGAKQQANMANLNIVQAAPLPIRPFKPRKLYLILLSSAGALLFSIAWAYAKEMNDTSFDNEQQLQSVLKLEPLATLPQVDLTGFRDPPPVVPITSLEPAQRLWSRLSNSGGTGFLASAFVSSRSGEGSTTVLLQAALTAQAEGRRVLVVDGRSDMALSKHLGATTNLNVHLQSSSDLRASIRQTQGTGLAILTIGNETTKIEDTAWQTLLESLQNDYDVVFFDVGAVSGLHPKPKFLASLDGIILVVAAHVTRREIVQQSIHEICTHSEAKMLGVVLNRRKLFVPEFLYRVV